MKKIILTHVFCLVSIAVFGQTFMTSFKHTFKGLKLENSGIKNIKDLACPQIQLASYNGSGKIAQFISMGYSNETAK